MTQQGYAVASELVQVQRVPAIGARNVRRGEMLLGNGQFVRRDVEKPDPGQPVEHILAAIAAGCSSRATDAQEYVAPVLMELFGDLGAGLCAADDEHSALRQQ